MATEGKIIGWDDEVTADDAGENNQQNDFVILPDGEYPLTVVKLERGSYKGSAKLPACNQVKLEFIAEGPDNRRAYVYDRFFMHTSCLWRIYALLEALGIRKKGDNTAAAIPWGKVEKGMTCRALLGSREYNGRTYNEVKKYLEPVAGFDDDFVDIPF